MNLVHYFRVLCDDYTRLSNTVLLWNVRELFRLATDENIIKRMLMTYLKRVLTNALFSNEPLRIYHAFRFLDIILTALNDRYTIVFQGYLSWMHEFEYAFARIEHYSEYYHVRFNSGIEYYPRLKSYYDKVFFTEYIPKSLNVVLHKIGDNDVISL